MIPETIPCPYCGAPMRLSETSRIYLDGGHDVKLFVVNDDSGSMESGEVIGYECTVNRHVLFLQRERQ